MIKAQCWSDDRCVEVEFDATPWFKQANKKQISELAVCGWCGAYPSDAVAHYMANRDKQVAEMFTYLDLRSRITTIGFECAVDVNDALCWLKRWRPYVFNAVSKIDNGI